MVELIKIITEIEAPEIESYRTLKRPHQHKEQGVFIVEGDKVVKRFLESSLQAISILLIPEVFDIYRKVIEEKPEKIKVYLASETLLKAIVGFRYHQGIMAVGKIPFSRSLNDILAHSKKPAILIAVDKLESAENTGVIVRNCAAGGVTALIVGPTSTDPYLRRAVRNSMGTLFKLPVIYSENLAMTLQVLRANYDFQVIAAHPRPDSEIISAIDFSRNSCIILGNEGAGISTEILNICDFMAQIPMVPGIDSLNVACASAVILYEIMRQRSQKLH